MSRGPAEGRALPALEDDGHCVACGRLNPCSIGLSFSDADSGVTAEYVGKKVHQGFKDIVHGGIITTILDEAMIQSVLRRGIRAVTAEITVRLRRPLGVGDRTQIEARIRTMGTRLITTEARMTRSGGDIIAEAAAKLFRHG